MKRINEYDHFSKMTEEKFSLPHLFLTLAQIQTFQTNPYIMKRKLVQENTCLFPYWHQFSIFLNQSMAKASLFRTGFIISNILKV